MRLSRNVFTLLSLIIGFILLMPNDSAAQNPARTKHYKKKAKKRMKPKDPYVLKKGGYPDDDKDGVPNYYDHCKFTPPAAERNYEVTDVGCPPDTDGDGLFDPVDQCPDSAGPKENKGCPWDDRDGDGIYDKDDICPDKPGLVRFNGCPDTDNDGVEDRKDKCPKDSGMVVLRGCPPEPEDTDGDGILNEDDVCPLKPGVKENHGCPEIKPEEKAALERAFDNLLFKTGSDVIQQSSFASLTDLASVLINNPDMKLHLEGHTDNQGNDADNLQLSRDRAAAVRRFLINKGVTGWRITSAGYGETRPVDTNKTAEGRRKNRRVEMTLKY